MECGALKQEGVKLKLASHERVFNLDLELIGMNYQREVGCVQRQGASTEISKPYVRVDKRSCLAGEENNEKKRSERFVGRWGGEQNKLLKSLKGQA